MSSRGAAKLMLLLALVLVAGGWGVGSPGTQAPPGCQEVYAATSRGGAMLPAGGGLSCGLPNLRTPAKGTVRVVRVIDGDTVEIAGGERVRYVGMDTPEVGQRREYFGDEATQANRKLVEGHDVRLELDVSERDRFGRLLRYVYVDGMLVNAELVREGYAQAVTYPPDTRFQACLQAFEDEARAQKRGMWQR